MNLQRAFKAGIKQKSFVSLASRTTLRIGGRAGAWFEPSDAEDLSKFLKGLPSKQKIFPIGCGSNLLVKDGIVDKVFIHLSGPDFCRICFEGDQVKAGAGIKLPVLVRRLTEKGLSGHEFLAGIPGTLGGALAMNAGARSSWSGKGIYREMKDIVGSVEAMDSKGRPRSISAKAARFSYRSSGLGDLVVLGATLKLKKGRPGAVEHSIKSILEHRKKAQDLGFPSAGSFFRNPDKGKTAGELIDLCGLKGFGVGRAFVSTKHANFIINKGGASYNDVIKLMEIIQETVYNRFKIHLQPEVKIVA